MTKTSVSSEKYVQRLKKLAEAISEEKLRKLVSDWKNPEKISNPNDKEMYFFALNFIWTFKKITKIMKTFYGKQYKAYLTGLVIIGILKGMPVRRLVVNSRTGKEMEYVYDCWLPEGKTHDKIIEVIDLKYGVEKIGMACRIITNDRRYEHEATNEFLSDLLELSRVFAWL